MKILVISNYRGLHTCRPEAEIFIGLAQRGFDITIMTYPDAVYIDRFRASGIRVIPEHPLKRYDRKFIALLKKELQEGGYDILQLYNNKAISNGVRSAQKIDVKVGIYRGASTNMSWLNPINYLKFFHPRIDFVICNSEEIRENFLAVPYYNKKKAITIFKGHNLDWYKDVEPSYIKRELGISDDVTMFVNVANNRKMKAIPDLIRAMKLIPKDQKIALLIIGKGMKTPEIMRLVKDSGNAEKIHILGYRKDSINIVAACDVFVLPSIGGESLTKSVVEAMSLGVVPIISDIRGNEPLVDDGEDGFVFPKGDFVALSERLLHADRQKSELQKIGKRAKLKIKNFINTKNTVDRYTVLYTAIVENRFG